MDKRLVVLVIAAALAALTACSGGRSIDQAKPGTDTVAFENAPAEKEVAGTTDTDASAEYDELLDPEFGCSGGGSIEYGLVNTHLKK